MRKRQIAQAAEFNTRKRKHRVWTRIVTILACIVVFCTTYALILPAITASNKTYCGMEEHSHTDACYEENLICGMEEGINYVEVPVETTTTVEGASGEVTEETTVTYEQQEVEHTHTEECYEKVLVCTLEEHMHTLSCYSNPDADLETASDWERTMSDVTLTGSWAEDLVSIASTQRGYCESENNYLVDDDGNMKGITRYGQWYGDDYGDWCAMFVSFCMYYAGIPNNYDAAAVAEDGTRVYMPAAAGVQGWIAQFNTDETPYYYAVNDTYDYTLINGTYAVCFGPENDDCGLYHPKAGDLIFFDWDGENGGDHVGIITGFDYDSAGNVATIYTIEGNSGSTVACNSYAADNTCILGIAAMPENPAAISAENADAITAENTETAASDEITGDASGEVSDDASEEIADETVTDEEISGASGEVSAEASGEASGEAVIVRTYDGEDFHITLTYSADAGIPDEAEVCVRELDGLELEKAVDDAKESAGFSEITFARAFDITFVLDGEEIEPTGSVDIRITYDDPVETADNEVGKVIHFADEGTEVITAMPEQSDEGTTFNFTQDSFSTSLTAVGQLQGGNYPRCSLTGSVTTEDPVLYNVDATTGTITATADVTYTIRYASGDKKGTVAATVESTNTSIAVSIGHLTAGTYTIEQTAVPPGYAVVSQTRTVTIDANGQGSVGIFYLYSASDFAADKTAQVIDYENRIYQVDLTAQSGKYQYTVDPINLILVVDQSNSMLFPAQLTETGKTVELYQKGSTSESYTYDNWYQGYDGKWYSYQVTDTRTVTNNDKLEALGLSHSTVYYLVGDTTGDDATSTVYALFWNGSGWCYQDASYYSKAYRHWVLGEESNVKESQTYTVNGNKITYDNYVQFPTYSDGWNDNTHGAGVNADVSGNGLSLWDDYGSSATSAYFTIYTGSEYNRLHELQQAVATLAGLIGSINSQSTLTLETFAKDVISCQSFTLTSDGVEKVVQAANNITTSGGTRQDLALRHVYGDYAGATGHQWTHLTNRDDYVVLITDGAPVSSTSQTVETTISTVVGYANTLKSKFSGDDKLITVGLSSGNVAGNMLPDSASTPSSTYYKKVEEAGLLKEYFMNLFLSQIMKDRKYITSYADVTDVVSDSFYITDKYGNPLKDGQHIDLEGNPVDSGPGTVHYDSTNNEWYVTWEQQALPANTITKYIFYDRKGYTGTATVLDTSQTYDLGYSEGGNYTPIQAGCDNHLVFENGKWIIRWSGGGTTEPIQRTNLKVIVTGAENSAGVNGTWHGKVYLKAKEDFIGGNTIDTNKSASVNVLNDDLKAGSAGISLPTPTVNVRLLPYAGNESEETLFLGDTVEDIQDKIQTLLDMTEFTKLVSGSGTVLNYKTDATEANGCYAGTFSLTYAAGELTARDWSRLVNGETIRKEYVYDEASSHGNVGYFTFTLKKDVSTTKANGEALTNPLTDHTATVTGQDVEKYTLSVTYTAYEISDGTRSANVHNGTNGPGTEVGTGSTLETGLGTESTDDVHHVHVVDGKMVLTKTIDSTLISDTDQPYTFTIWLVDDSGSQSKYADVTVTVPAKATTGSVTLENLPRGTYRVEEASGESYQLKGVEVVTNGTNCKYTEGDTSLVFEIGTNTASKTTSSTSYYSEDKDVILLNNSAPVKEASTWDGVERYVYTKLFTSLSAAAAAPATETVDVKTYEWPSGTIISTNISGSQYERLTQTAAQLDASHTSYAILTQDAGDADKWSIEYHAWIEKKSGTTTYDWPSGTIISTNTSGTQYERLTSSASTLDASHTSYGILTQDASGSWSVEWHNWSSKNTTTTSYTLPSGTIISTDVSGQYQALTQTADELDAAHTNYGILTKNASGTWKIEWHTWTEQAGTVTGATTTYEPVVISYRTYTSPDLSEYENGSYYYKNYKGEYEQITEIYTGGTNNYNIIISTTGRTKEWVGVTGTWDGTQNNHIITYTIYRKVVSGGTTGASTWKETVTTEDANTAKLPTTSTTKTTWSENVTSGTADTSKIPSTTVTDSTWVEYVSTSTADSSKIPGTTTQETRDVVTLSAENLSVGAGIITNTRTKYTAEIPVKKIWSDGAEHKNETVYVVLYNRDDTPVTDTNGNAQMLKLNSSNGWTGKFTVSTYTKDYDPVGSEDYYVREVTEAVSRQYVDTPTAVVVNDASDTTVYNVKTAADGEIIQIGVTGYEVKYTTDAATKTLVVTNYTAYELPESGGIGTFVFTAVGLLIMAGSLVIYFTTGNGRKRERRSQ